MKKVLFVLFVAAMAVATSCRNQATEAAPAETPAEAPVEAAPVEAAPAEAAPVDTTATAPAH